MNKTKFSNAELFNFDLEEQKKSKCNLIIGTDEAGRGPATGPVFAAAVCFRTLNDNIIAKFARLNDSKKLSERTRQELMPIIKQYAVYSVQMCDENLIDRINILNSTFEAMKNACMDVVRQVRTTCLVLVDGNHKIKGYDFPQKTVIKGDTKSASIAAASVLAKVSRDAYMLNLDREFPMYNWKKNKGYLSKEHIDAILKYGPCKFHRKTFLRNILEKQNIEQKTLNLC